MKHAAWIAISAGALGLAGCGDNADTRDEAVTSADVAATATSPATTAAASQGQQFANTAAGSDNFEIESSRLAATRASSAKIKEFAEQMIAAHTDSTAKLNTASAAASPPIMPVPQFNPMQQQTLDTLAAQTGSEFDTAYAKAQVDAHQATLDQLKAYSTTGDVPSLKAFATDLVPIVTKHLEMARAL